MTGTLIDLDMPAMFAPSLFEEVGPRIVRLRETFASGGDEMDACTIRFSDFKLYVRAMQTGFICILSSIGVNMPALKMGAQLAQRRILAELGLSDGSPVSSPPPSLAPPSWTAGAYGPASSRAALLRRHPRRPRPASPTEVVRSGSYECHSATVLRLFREQQLLDGRLRLSSAR